MASFGISFSLEEEFVLLTVGGLQFLMDDGTEGSENERHNDVLCEQKNCVDDGKQKKALEASIMELEMSYYWGRKSGRAP